MAFTDQQYIDEIRNLTNDGPLSKLVKGDNTTALIQSGRVQFPLANKNIVDPEVITGAVFKAQVDGANFEDATLTDPVTGVGTVVTAPAKSIVWMYYFHFTTDAQIRMFRDNGMRQVGIDPTNASARANLPQNLYAAVCYLAAAEALRITAQDAVKYYDQASAGKNFAKSAVYKNRKEQADSYEEKGMELRKSIYTRQDRSLQPFFSVAGSINRVNQRTPTR